MKTIASILFIALHTAAFAQGTNTRPWEKYDYADDNLDGKYRRVGRNGRLGMVDSNWHEIVPCAYRYAMTEHAGFVEVQSDNKKYGLIDSNGRSILPCIYETTSVYENGFIEVELNDKRGLVNYAGQKITECIYDDIDIRDRPNETGTIVCRQQWSYGTIDTTGKVMIPVQYDEIYYLGGGRFRVRQNKLEGMVTTDHKTILPCAYSDISGYDDSLYYRVTDTKDRMGLVDAMGKWIIPCKYDLIIVLRSGIYAQKGDRWWTMPKHEPKALIPMPKCVSPFSNYCQVKSRGKYGIADSNGTLQIPKKFDRIRQLGPDVFAVADSNKWGMYTLPVGQTVPCVYDFIDIAMGRPYPIWVRQYGKWGAVNKNGKLIIPIRYPSTYWFNNGIAQLDGYPIKYLDTSGREFRLPASQYTYVDGFHSGRAIVKDDQEYYGYINRQGKFDVATELSDASSFSEGLATTALDAKNRYGGERMTEHRRRPENLIVAGFIDSTGKPVIPRTYDYAQSFHDNRASVKKGDLWGAIDRNGKVAIPFVFHGPFDFNEGSARVTIDDKRVLIDTNGNTLRSDSLDYDTNFRDGIATVHNKLYKYGFVNTSGKLTIPCIYNEQPTHFANGVAAIAYKRYNCYGVNTWYGVINKKGDTVVPLKYDRITPFSEGRAVVTKCNRHAVIDTTGTFITDFLYDGHAEGFHEGLLAVKANGKWGYIDTRGNTVIPCTYTEAHAFSEGLAGIKTESGWGFIDKSGKQVIWFPH